MSKLCYKMRQPDYYLSRPPPIRRRRNAIINQIRNIFLDKNGNECPNGINIKIIEFEQFVEIIDR